jgi:hypothetical protein
VKDGRLVIESYSGVRRLPGLRLDETGPFERNAGIVDGH